MLKVTVSGCQLEELRAVMKPLPWDGGRQSRKDEPKERMWIGSFLPHLLGCEATLS